MAIDSISALSPITAYTQRIAANASSTAHAMQARAAQNTPAGTAPRMELVGPETAGNWNWAAAQPGVSASPSETEGSIRSASNQIAQAYGSGRTTPADIRNASEAYRNQSSARDQAAQQQQGNGTRTLDIFA
jgi:hypothetical protein